MTRDIHNLEVAALLVPFVALALLLILGIGAIAWQPRWMRRWWGQQ